ncbi:TVP38/TMEM64 family protein [Enterococcus durans]|uniref:TVP38/TMEM64 family protein n=2 Tax=Enterococcus durans TaxID=53345 RepID=UPI0018D37CF2|nr:VTT domain-containing protein [Enterococcus durans]QPQ26915.1 TVP38/TMEM64 family protein [Enterococcus durans]QXB38639.1 VTT domain-containing protein [Enterococcus durans]
MESKKLQKVLIALGISLILFLGYHLYLEYQADIHLLIDPKANEQQLLHSVRSHGLSAAVILILLMGIMCAIPGVPTAVIGVIVGLSYGPFLGALINIVGNASGNILAISLMQHLKLVDHSKKSNRWVKAIRSMKHPKIGIMVGYMVPIIPSSVINFATTTLNLQVREILMSIIIGVIPLDLSQYLGHILVETVKPFFLLLILQIPVGLDSESSYGFDFGYKILQCS